jgi:hypothetical protein
MVVIIMVIAAVAEEAAVALSGQQNRSSQSKIETHKMQQQKTKISEKIFLVLFVSLMPLYICIMDCLYNLIGNSLLEESGNKPKKITNVASF